jgi:DNA-binding response OmpR family regulator
MKERPIKVLLVEDNPGDARLVQETLSEVDSPEFELVHVERLSQARQRLTEERFDVVLLDLVLPDKPRMGSLIEIHDQASRVPIIVLTGLDDETMASWTLEEGAQDYLIKGQTDRESLVRCIRHAIQRHRTQSGRVRTAPAHFV